MARINSIALGKARGKIGNVVFQSYHGMTTARQKNETISIPPTQAQINVRKQCGNANSAWSYLKGFLENWTNQGKGYESLWNTFYRMTLDKYATTRPIQANRSVNMLFDGNFGKADNINIYSITKILQNNVLWGVRVSFAVLAPEYQESLKMYVYVKELTGAVQGFRDVVITEENWTNGYIDIQFEDINIGIAAAYAQHFSGWSDNLLFSAAPIE